MTLSLPLQKYSSLEIKVKKGNSSQFSALTCILIRISLLLHSNRTARVLDLIRYMPIKRYTAIDRERQREHVIR